MEEAIIEEVNPDEGYGGFYAPAVGADGLATPLTAGTLDSAMEAIRAALPVETMGSSEEQAKAFVTRVIPQLNTQAPALRKQYVHEYGAASSGSGCQCFCRK